VEPYGLVAKAGVWYLVYARKGHFLVRGMADLLAVHVLEESFFRTPDFDLPSFWQEWVADRQGQLPRFIVLARAASMFLPQLPYYLGECIYDVVDEQGCTLIRLRFDSFEEARTRLLGLGRAVEVLEPLELRTVLRDYAEQILSLYP
jgi:predicted DNA-binding transcriptional regulator YafY